MQLRSLLLVFLVAAALWWTHATCALAQPGGDKPATAAQASAHTVNLPVIVRDKRGTPVAQLTAGDLTITDNGRPQTVQALTQSSSAPLQTGLLVDTDRSMTRAMDSERKAAAKFIDVVLPAAQTGTASGNQTFLIHFDREVELLEDFTSTREKLLNDIEQLGPTHAAEHSQGPETTDSEGRRSNFHNASPQLYDAIYLAADNLMKSRKGRKALIVFGNGLDGGSKESLDQAIDAAERAGVPVYAIYFRGDEERPESGYSGRRRGGMGGGWPGSGGGWPGGQGGGGRPGSGGGRSRLPQVDGKKIMEQIATRTGGVYFEAKKTADLDDIYSQVGHDVLGQYLLSYTPDHSGNEADFHKVIVKSAKSDLIVSAPEGYYSSGDDSK